MILLVIIVFLSERETFSFPVSFCSFLARIFLLKMEITGQPYKKDLAGYVTYP